MQLSKGNLGLERLDKRVTLRYDSGYFARNAPIEVPYFGKFHMLVKQPCVTQSCCSILRII